MALSNLQPCPDVDISARNLRCADEDVSTVATSTIDPDGVFASVGLCAVKGNFAALVAVSCIRGPCGLVPTAFEAFGDLGNGERGEREREREKSGLSDHD